MFMSERLIYAAGYATYGIAFLILALKLFNVITWSWNEIGSTIVAIYLIGLVVCLLSILGAIIVESLYEKRKR